MPVESDKQPTDPERPPGHLPGSARVWSTVILAAGLLLAAVLFFRVVRPFLFPLLFSAILAVLLRSTHRWLTRICGNRARLAAGLTTVGALLLVMLPASAALLLAAMEMADAGRELLQGTGVLRADQASVPTLTNRIAAFASEHFNAAQVKQLESVAATAIRGATQLIYDRTQALATDLIGFFVSIVIMLLGCYYLLADGDRLGQELTSLLRLDPDDERLMFQGFEDVCRGVVVATVASGLVQGVLAWIGFAVLQVQHIWLLAMLTVLFAFIPFLGAAMVWVVVALSLVMQDRIPAAVILAIYGTLVISMSDNLVKAHVIGSRSRMHPFVVLVTVLGAMRLAGLWGIFLGPVTAAFFYALLISVRKRFVEPEASEPSEAPKDRQQ